jgi:hypothetical protein
MADHDRAYAVTVAAIVIPVAIPVPVPIEVAVTITVPEYAPITITIAIIIIIIITGVEATQRAAVAAIAIPATYAPDLLDDAQLVLRRPNIGRAGKADRVGAVGQQRGAENGCGGGQRQQELVHFSSSSFLRSWPGKADSPSRKNARD